MHSLLDTLFNFKVTEDRKYLTLGNQGPFELRLYERSVLAKIDVDGAFAEAFVEGKRQLCDYIRGSNFQVEPVACLPVFFQTINQEAWEVGTILNHLRVTPEIPRPLNRRIRLEEVSPRKVAVLRFNSLPSQEAIMRRGEELRKWIEYKNLDPTGLLRVCFNDGIVSLPFLRNNEVQLDVL